jgi:PAS domain S-box-containing protein
MGEVEPDQLNNYLFQEIVNQANEGILIIHDGRIIYSNKQIKSHLALPGDLDDRALVDEIFACDERSTVLWQIKQMGQGAKKSLEWHAQINQMPFELSLQKSVKNNNEYIILKTNLQTRHTSQLRSDKNNIREILPFIYVETDGMGSIMTTNKKFHAILGYSLPETAKGFHLKEIVSGANQHLIDSLLNAKDENGKSEFYEIKLRMKSGESFPVNMYFKTFASDTDNKRIKFYFLDISENKKLEKKYRHNQQRLRKILDLVPQIIFLKDREGKILLTNKAGAEFYRKSPKDMVYEKMETFLPNKEELALILEQDRHVIDKQEPYHCASFILTDTDNQKHIFKTTKIPFRHKGSDEVYSLGISENITKQSLAEAEKDEANEKYRLLVEHGSDGILILWENKIVFANKQAARIIGKTTDEIIGFPLTSFLPKDQLQKSLVKFKSNLQNPKSDNYYSIKLPRPDGKNIYLEASISMTNFQGRKSRIVFVRDVTKRRLAEKQSQRDRNLLEQAQKIANLGTWEWDLLQNTLLCSDEIFTILEEGKQSDGKRDITWLARFIQKQDRRKIIRGLLAALKTGQRYQADFQLETTTGNLKIIHSQSMVFLDSSGKPERLVGTWLDITERIKIEQLLKEAKTKAEESDKLKSAFLANMSHEIRTPMNAVLGFASLLKREDISEKTRIEYIDHILQSGEGLIKLINDIVDISKIESNQLQIEKCTVSINQLLDQLFNRYEELLLLKHNMNVVLKYETAMPDPEFSVMTDPYRLQQVLSNLLNNAIKFTYHGEIKFGYTIARSELLFFVEDQGIGIPDDKKEAIFERFGKLDDPERLNKSGAGLGLSISRSLVELLGGKIWLDTSYTQGARFNFTLPLEIVKPNKLTERQSSQKYTGTEINLRGKTILIAEDEALNFKLLEALIKKTGAKILWAKNGSEAVKFAFNEKIDLIFMDIKMPDMDGYEATKHIKRMDPAIPIIAQTAFAFSNERNYIIQSGCDMYMTKPIDHNELNKALKIFLTTA